MNSPSTAREAMIAEILGDLEVAIDRLEEAIAAGNRLDKTLGVSTQALTTAGENYRVQINDMVARLRVETSAMLIKTTEHAANALVGKQTLVLQAAATNAVRKAIQDGLGRRLRKYFVIAVLLSGVLSAAIVIAAITLSG